MNRRMFRTGFTLPLPDDNGGGSNTPDPEGGGGGGGGDTAQPKTFTQADVDRIVSERLERQKATLTKDYADYDDLKTKAEQFDTFAKAFTGDTETPPDPAKLSADLAAAQQQARETKIENAVLLCGGEVGAALLDSRSFMAEIGTLDPTAADFEAQVKAKVTDRLKNTPPPSAAGTGVDLYINHPSSNKTSSRELGAAEADRRFGTPKT